MRSPPSHPFALQIPRGAVKRTPIKQELSAEELAQFKEQAALEEAAESRMAGDSDDDGSEEEEKSSGKKKGRKGKVDPLADPAFASLRDVELPEGMDLDLDNDSDGDEDDSDDEEEEDKAEKISNQRSRDTARARGQAALDARVLGHRMDDMNAPASFEDEDDEPEDAEDLLARPSDCFLVVANTEEEYSNLEVHVYSPAEGALYVHHDITLPAFPLCVAWMDYAGSAAASNAATQRALMAGAAMPGGATADPASTVGSYVAVGTFKPDIEIWNADVLDPLEPSLVLRAAPGAAGKPGSAAAIGKKAAKAASASAASSAAGSSVGHSDAVMGLAWNRAHRHLLASCSADKTVKVWDLDGSSGSGTVLHTYAHHKGKVQAVAWNPVETSVLASASYDRTIAVTDARSADKTRVARYALPGDPESLQWNVHNPAAILASCEDGSIVSFDVRMPDAPLWSVSRAHAGSVTAMAQSLLARGLLATGSLDKSVKLWDTLTAAPAPGAAPGKGGKAASGGAPVCVAGKAMTIGQIFTLSFFPNAPFLLAAGGSKGVVAVWDIEADGGEAPPSAPPAPVSVAPVAGLLAADASPTAKRFGARLVTDPGSVPGNPLAVRARHDAQQC